MIVRAAAIADAFAGTGNDVLSQVLGVLVDVVPIVGALVAIVLALRLLRRVHDFGGGYDDGDSEGEW